MIYFSKIEDNGQHLRFTLNKGGMLVLRIALKSNFVAPAVLQPRLEDWVTEEGAILTAAYKASPAYLYVSPNSISHFTLTVPMPADAEPAQNLSGTLHFSSIQHCAVKIQVLIADPQDTPGAIEEHLVNITIPDNNTTAPDHSINTINRTEQTAKLLSMLASLEVLPSKWLVAELALSVCERGLQAMEQEEYRVLAEQLTKTRFFKNAVLVFSAAQFVHWVLLGLSISAGLQAVTARKKKSARMIHNWEEWLMNLADHDVESTAQSSSGLQFPQDQHYEAVINRIGMEPDKWLLYLLLGLMQISPRQKAIVEQLCRQIPENKKRKPGATKKKVKNVLNEKGSLQR